jgi:large subunit ribosomal protein L29
MATTTNIPTLSDEALTHHLFEVERDLVRARFAHSMGQLENTATLGRLRKSIARIKTETRKRELSQGLPKDALIRAHRASFKAAASTESVGQSAEERGGFLQGIVDKLTGSD